MNEKEARNISVGARVMWDNNHTDAGTVREVGYTGLSVDWDNGQNSWVDFEDAEQVSLWRP